MIHHTLGNNKDRTAQTLREQSETPFARKFNELRTRYPETDMLTLMDAASQALAEAETLEQQLEAAISRTDATLEHGQRVLDSMEAYRQECYEAGYSAFLDGDAGGYAPGKNCYWYEGWQAAADEEYEWSQQNDDIGRDESLYPWLY